MFSVCSQLMGAHSHVMGSQVPGYSQLMWSRNSGCYWFLRVMLSGRYICSREATRICRERFVLR